MDWLQVQRVICDGRNFTTTDGGCRVLSDALMPSGALIHIHIQSRGDGMLSMHDGGAAFDELAREALEIKSMAGVRRMLNETGFRLTDDGCIWRDHIEIKQAFAGISILSDASVRAAGYLISRASYPHAMPLDVRIKDALKMRFPQGRANFTVEGKHRQHVFDFGAEINGTTLLAQAVSPDSASVSAAVMKGIDAQKANSNVVPLFFYDPADRWQSGALGMLEFGGRGMSVDGIRTADLLAA